MYLEDRNTGTLMAISFLICLSVSQRNIIFLIFTWITGIYVAAHIFMLLRKAWKGVFKNGKK